MTTRHASPPVTPAMTAVAPHPAGSLARFTQDLAAQVGVTAPLIAEQVKLLGPEKDLIARQARLLGLLETAIRGVAREHGVCRPAGCNTCRPVRFGMAALVADAEITQARIDRIGAAA